MLEEKELLEKLVAESNSYAEILRKLGKSNSGLATRLLKQKLDDCGIGRIYGVSDNSIRKWCKKEGLPSTKTELKKYLCN